MPSTTLRLIASSVIPAPLLPSLARRPSENVLRVHPYPCEEAADDNAELKIFIALRPLR